MKPQETPVNETKTERDLLRVFAGELELEFRRAAMRVYTDSTRRAMLVAASAVNRAATKALRHKEGAR